MASDSFREKFALNLRRLREAADLTQEELATLSGLNRTHVYFLEQGMRSPKLETLEKLAKGLKIQPGELLPDIKLNSR